MHYTGYVIGRLVQLEVLLQLFKKNWELELLRLSNASLRWPVIRSILSTYFAFRAFFFFFDASVAAESEASAVSWLPEAMVRVKVICRSRSSWSRCAVCVIIRRSFFMADRRLASCCSISRAGSCMPWFTSVNEPEYRFWPSSSLHSRWRPGRCASDLPAGSWSGSSHNFSRQTPPGSAFKPLTNFFFWLPLFLCHPTPCHRQTLNWSS